MSSDKILDLITNILRKKISKFDNGIRVDDQVHILVTSTYAVVIQVVIDELSTKTP